MVADSYHEFLCLGAHEELRALVVRERARRQLADMAARTGRHCCSQGLVGQGQSTAAMAAHCPRAYLSFITAGMASVLTLHAGRRKTMWWCSRTAWDAMLG